MTVEDEKKSEERLEAVGLGYLPPFFLPAQVLRFRHRDPTDLWKNGHEYFDAVLACEMARQMTHRLRRNLRLTASSPKYSGFALPKSPIFGNGLELSDILSGLTKELDNKRERMVEAMEDPPLIEKFLSKMEASVGEEKVFRHVLAASCGMLPNNKEDHDRFNQEVRIDPYGPPKRYSVAVSDLQTIFFDEMSLADLMSLTAVQSTWVKEQIYDRSSRLTNHMSGMADNTVRVFMGAGITVSQYQEIDSSLLQEVLLEDKHFRQTEAGKVIIAQHGQSLAFPEGAKEENGYEGEKCDELPAPLVEALSGAADEKDRVFKALAVASSHQEKATIEDAPTDSTDDSQHKGENDFGPYRSELDYLEDQIRLMDKDSALNKAKAELKDDGNGDDSPLKIKSSRFGRGEPVTKDDIKLEKGIQAEKLEVKLKKLREKVVTRLWATKKQRNKTPRLEQLCEALDLNQFERFVILDLIRMVIMPFHYDMDNEDGLPSGIVAAYIERFSHSLEEKMNCRKYFYKSSTLVKEGIITISGTDFKTDLNQCSVHLDRRMFDYIIGLDTEFSELVDGSHLYTPDVSLDDVILPKDTKDRICDCVLNFDRVKNEYHNLEVEKKITYGLGNVLLFYGSSGTGKTMMANALAAKLKKKVLLVNFPTLGVNTSGDLIKFLFREARIKKAMIFFDECESLFGSRERGNYEVNTILNELERFDDLCILATNRPCDLDEAMHRRVSLAIEFKKPDLILREKIWKTLAPPKLPLDGKIAFGELARRYELAGGFIKNAWLNSISLMIKRGDDKVMQRDLEQAASEQVIGRLSNEDFDRQVVPTCGIEAVVASPQAKEALGNIVHHAKAQAVLFGQWGFGKVHRTPTGVSALFCGPPGTGKTMAAEAIGFDLGSPLKVVNTAELVNKYVGETGKNIEAVFREAKQKEALLVFDEAEGLFGNRVQDCGSTSRHDTINVGLLLRHIENFSGVCIVITNQRDAIDEAFFRRFRFVLNFEQPNVSQRVELWRSIIPDECPLSADVSLPVLAKSYEMCGGDIKSAVLRAATRAALRESEEERVVCMKDLEGACEEEMRKKSEGKGGNGMYA